MNRRDFIKAVAIASAAGRVGVLASPATADTRVNTVVGPVPAGDLGSTLMHEHVLTDSVGADRIGQSRYDAQEVIRVALPHLIEAKKLGCGTLVECTPAYMGRNPSLLAALSKSSGLHIITNTGIFGAGGHRYVPQFAYSETVEQLASRWTREVRDGIPPTGIRPGIIKIGADAGRLDAIDAKLAAAAAITHLRTGLVILSHAGNGIAAMEQLSVIRKLGVNPSAFIWGHAQDEKDAAYHRRAIDDGVWISFDGISPDTLRAHIALVAGMKNGRTPESGSPFQ